MNRADEIRDQIRQMRYLSEEKRFIDEMLRKIEDQKNRLQVEELSLLKILKDKSDMNSVNREIEEEQVEQVNTNNYFSSGTPSRPIEVPIVDSFPLNDHFDDQNHPKAVAETIELDVSKVLLKLASGGNQVEEESDDDDD